MIDRNIFVAIMLGTRMFLGCQSFLLLSPTTTLQRLCFPSAAKRHQQPIQARPLVRPRGATSATTTAATLSQNWRRHRVPQAPLGTRRVHDGIVMSAAGKATEEQRGIEDGSGSGEGGGEAEWTTGRKETKEERIAAINKQIYQSKTLVGSKMMTIDSFGPDSSTSSSKGRRKVSTATSATTTPEERLPQVMAMQAKLYEKRKWRLIGDNVFLGLLGSSGAWCVSIKTACSFGLGSALGTAYLVLLSRFVENIGKDDSNGGGRAGGGGGGPARLALAGLLVLLVAKNKEIFDMIPAVAGFLAYQIATLVQGIYTDFDEVEDAEATG